MKEISATEAARHLSAVLDAVEYDHEVILVTRGGRGVARIVPAAGTTGRTAKEVLRRHRPDRSWAGQLDDLRSFLASESPP